VKRALALLPVALAVAAAGCGSKRSDPSPSPAARSSFTTVTTRSTELGTVLVDGHGKTLYLFEKDKGPASTCTDACASAWPPVTADGKVTAGGGVDAAKLASTKRADGTTEITYAGHPLYTYAGDAKPGDVNGQNLDQFGAEWYVLAPSGSKIEDDD
jgi:predicted lipoprotein with Yx(FWY)xxD motif